MKEKQLLGLPLKAKNQFLTIKKEKQRGFRGEEEEEEKVMRKKRERGK